MFPRFTNSGAQAANDCIFSLSCPLGITPPTSPQEMPADQPVSRPEPPSPSIQPPPPENPVPVSEPPRVHPPVAALRLH